MRWIGWMLYPKCSILGVLGTQMNTGLPINAQVSAIATRVEATAYTDIPSSRGFDNITAASNNQGLSLCLCRN